MTGDASLRQRHIADLLTGVTSLARKIMTAHHNPFHARGLGRTQAAAIFVLAHTPAPVTPTTLVTKLGITAGAVTQLVDSLRDLGLVESSVNPADSRSRLLRLSETARAEIDSFEQQVVADLTPTFDPLSTDDLGQLAALVGRLGL